jgi:undecaprenyl-diphosphatase
MLDLLYSLDTTAFHFCNQTIANPVFDAAMPFITDMNQHWYGLVFLGGLWTLLFWKGGKKGRTVALLLIPLIAMSDQLSSTVIKNIVARPRPCHTVNGMKLIQDIRELVPCGSGFSFPSSHAVNNVAAATLLSHFYRRWSWAFFAYAGLMAFSRISVGVHFPSDVLGGAVIGAAISFTLLACWQALVNRFPLLSVSESLSHDDAPHG